MNDNIQILVLFGFLYVFPRISPVFNVGTVSPGNPGNSWCQETSQPPEVAEEVPGRCCRICLEDWDCGESGNLGICIASICTFIIYLSLKHMHTYAYLGTPKGHNFSLKRKNRLLGSQAEILVWGWFQAIFWYSGWFCLNLNLNLERNKAESRKEVKNYLVIPMLTVSFSCPVELGQTII